jgi:hypothetical protein
LQAEENGQHHTHKAHKHSCNQELLGNHFVVLAKDVLRNEAFFVVMAVVVVSMVCMLVVPMVNRVRFVDLLA